VAGATSASSLAVESKFVSQSLIMSGRRPVQWWEMRLRAASASTAGSVAAASATGSSSFTAGATGDEGCSANTEKGCQHTILLLGACCCFSRAGQVGRALWRSGTASPTKASFDAAGDVERVRCRFRRKG
jgi:hypothetical protein